MALSALFSLVVMSTFVATSAYSETHNVLELSDLYAYLKTVKSSVDSLRSEVRSLSSKVSALRPAKCPTGWYKWSSSCYFIPLWKASWTGSQRICERLGGHLATIESSSENSIIQSFRRSLYSRGLPYAQNTYFWIGGSDLYRERTWTWVNGKSFSYKIWASGQPNGGTSYNCLRWYYNGYFYSGPCSSDYNFICERDTF